jgi:peptidoglycan/LPS O-acetylase OafA/YrhL
VLDVNPRPQRSNIVGENWTDFMQHVLRFILSLLVVVAHATENFQATYHFGIYAVFGFYVLSGYLMTMVLNENYQFQFIPFVWNRFLRLFPVYWLVWSASLVIILMLPGASSWKETWNVTTSPMSLLANLLIVPYEFYTSDYRIVPPAWSVAVELVNYFLLFIFIARSRLFAFAALALATVYHIYALLTFAEFWIRYLPFYAAILPFTAGSIVYFARQQIDRVSETTIKSILAVSTVIWAVNLLAFGFYSVIDTPEFNFSFYLNLTLFVVMISACSHASLRTIPRGLPKLLGDIAYPIFLMHWQVMFLMSVLFLDSQKRGIAVLLISLPIIIILAIAAQKLADMLIEPMRDKIRPKLVK